MATAMVQPARTPMPGTRVPDAVRTNPVRRSGPATHAEGADVGRARSNADARTPSPGTRVREQRRRWPGMVAVVSMMVARRTSPATHARRRRCRPSECNAQCSGEPVGRAYRTTHACQRPRHDRPSAPHRRRPSTPSGRHPLLPTRGMRARHRRTVIRRRWWLHRGHGESTRWLAASRQRLARLLLVQSLHRRLRKVGRGPVAQQLSLRRVAVRRDGSIVRLARGSEVHEPHERDRRTAERMQRHPLDGPQGVHVASVGDRDDSGQTYVRFG